MNKPCTPLSATKDKGTMQSYLSVWNDCTRLTFLGLLTLLLMVFPLMTSLNAQAYCTIVCNDELTISLGSTCETTIYYDQIVVDGDNSRTCSPNGKWGFTILVFDGDTEIPTSPTIPYEYVGQTLQVKAKHWATGNACWSSVKVLDKVFPRLTCPPNKTVACTGATVPEITGNPQATDCSEIAFNYTDTYIDLECGDPVAQIKRRWTATDAGGNEDFCVQTISIAQPTIEGVVFPANVDGIDKDALTCEKVAADPTLLLPANTGAPLINGQAIENNGPCRLIPDYTDQIVESCEGTYKILRTWTVVNWCNSAVTSEVQIIKVLDKNGPEIVLPASPSFTTNATLCEATITVPAATITDACSGSITISIQSSFGTLHSNGGTIENVPVGAHTFTYTAIDGCGNTSVATLEITVVDAAPPTPICEDKTVISITSDGASSAFVQSFDNGTFDNCCLESVLIRRDDTPDLPFGTSVSFSCADIAQQVIVKLEATDCYQNKNFCWVEVMVEDKVMPTITCPANQTIDCADDYSDLSIFGTATATDNCDFELKLEESTNLDNCGQGTITRTWAATDMDNQSATCIQTISVVNEMPWNTDGQQIVWPKDYESSECLTALSLAPEDLPEGFGEPTILGVNSCALIATNYDDVVLSIEPPACYKIVRTWSVIDWCSYDVNSPDGVGRYEYSQVIKVLDKDAPIFDPVPGEVVLTSEGEQCGVDVVIPAVTVKDCSPNITVTVQGDLGEGYGPFSNVYPGNYTMTYTAIDGCGNIATAEIRVVVRDTKKPTPVCLGALAVTLMKETPTAEAMVDIWSTDLNQKSFDNCTPDEDLSVTIRHYDPDDESVPTTESITFTCLHLGTQAVEVWVQDNVGNADYCITSVIVQDNMNVCGSGDYTEEEEEEEEIVEEETMTGIAGKIVTSSGNSVMNVEVQISDATRASYMTKESGDFQFMDLPNTSDYTITPMKNTNPLNGVSTFDLLLMRKHILSIELIDSPYKMIAADINRSGTVTAYDLVELRKLILTIYDNLPNNTSWRFVPKNYIFPDPVNPFKEAIPESYLVQASAEEMVNVEFVAIKIGDLNDSALANELQTSTTRNSSTTINLSVKELEFNAGEQVKVALHINDLKEIQGYQFALQFDNEVLAYTGYAAEAIDNLEDYNFGLRQVENGIITTSWETLQARTIANNQSLFELNFFAKKDGKLSDILELNNTYVRAEIYDEATAVYALDLTYIPTDKESEQVQLYQNQPNPFAHSTTIGFQLPQAEIATLTIYDSRGTILQSITNTFDKGYNEVQISSTLSSGGLLYYVLETSKERISRKMLIVK